jgi:hypothetical protein
MMTKTDAGTERLERVLALVAVVTAFVVVALVMFG